MTKFFIYINESYNNWTFPDMKTMKMDFEEYKKKENKKWESRANTMGFRFPLFDSFDDFKDSLNNSKKITITDSWINKIGNLTDIKNLDDLKALVQSYKRPRDIERIIKGLQTNKKIPYPIILKGRNGYFIMAGNTRINTARILDIKPIALLVDISKKEI